VDESKILDNDNTKNMNTGLTATQEHYSSFRKEGQQNPTRPPTDFLRSFAESRNLAPDSSHHCLLEIAQTPCQLTPTVHPEGSCLSFSVVEVHVRIIHNPIMERLGNFVNNRLQILCTKGCLLPLLSDLYQQG